MLKIPASINDAVTLAFAEANGYEPTIVITPAQASTFTYVDGAPVNTDAVAEVDGPNPQTAEDFVSSLFTAQMINVYKQSQIDSLTAQAKADLATAIETSTASVEASIQAAN